MYDADEYPEYRDYLRLKFGPNKTTDELPEYKEYLKNLQTSTETPCEIRQYDQKFDIFDHMNRDIHLPIPCSEIRDNFGNYNFYCIALILLWFMLIVSAILYQFRSIVNIKNKITRTSNIEISTNNQGENDEHNTN
ncbi:hypothetical protein ACQ4LE_005048 [Meloidogyne hapla]